MSMHIHSSSMHAYTSDTCEGHEQAVITPTNTSSVMVCLDR